jgi:hypothetical protein
MRGRQSWPYHVEENEGKRRPAPLCSIPLPDEPIQFARGFEQRSTTVYMQVELLISSLKPPNSSSVKTLRIP